jgi:hypothetical protein
MGKKNENMRRVTDKGKEHKRCTRQHSRPAGYLERKETKK